MPKALKSSSRNVGRGSSPVDIPGPERFDTFFRRERRAMVAVAYAASGNRLAAEDIAQDAFLAAFRDWERVGGLDNLATWVRRVVINRSVSVIRTRAVSTRALSRLRGHADRVELVALPLRPSTCGSRSVGFPSVNARSSYCATSTSSRWWRSARFWAVSRNQ